MFLSVLTLPLAHINIMALFALHLGGCAVEVKMNGSPFSGSTTSAQERDAREAEIDRQRKAIMQRLKKENPRLNEVELHKRAQEELQVQLYGQPTVAYTSAPEE
jgi:hypothetical protein